MLSKIIIHSPQNFNSRNYRYYNIFFDNFISYLKNSFDIIENRYSLYAHTDRFPVKFNIDFDNKELPYSTLIQECEIILENYDNNQLKILSVSDFFTNASLGLFNSDRYHQYVSKILISQFNRSEINNHSYGKDIEKVYSPWIYFPSNLYNLEYFYNKRKTFNSLINKMYFRGSGLEHRPLLKYLNESIFYGGNPIGNFEVYANEAINYKIGLSCAGSAQFCYRDIEYMAMGIPMIRFEYSNEMNPQLVPNYHYISTNIKKELTDEHNLTSDDASIIEARFLEISKDNEFLEFISHNARDYYLKNIHDQNGILHTFDLLNMNEWK